MIASRKPCWEDAMAILTIPDATYKLLEARAAALGTTVDAVAAPVIEQLAREPVGTDPPAPADLSYEEWKRHFDAWMAAVAARTDRYPPGHTTDVSRESMYEGCGE